MSRRVVDEYFEEVEWTCKSCDQKGVKGRHMACPNCGSPKEAHEQYVAPGVSNEVTDPERLEEAQAGPNWTCRFCKMDQRSLSTQCKYCGADQREHAHSSADESPPPDPSPNPPIVPPRPARRRPPIVFESNPLTDLVEMEEARRTFGRGSSGNALRTFLIALVGIGLLALLIWALIPREANARISRIYWEHTTILEELQTKHGEDWKEDLPRGATIESCARRDTGKKENCQPYDCTSKFQEACGKEIIPSTCKKECEEPNARNNGYRKCQTTCDERTKYCTREKKGTCYNQCPIYKDYCSFTYLSWEQIDSKSSSGTTHATSWPEIQKRGIDTKQRVKQLPPTYTVVFREGNKEHVLTTHAETEFQKYSVGDGWKIKVSVAGVSPVHRLP